MRKSLLFTTSALALSLLAVSDSSASLAKTEAALRARQLASQAPNPHVIVQQAPAAAQDTTLRAELERMKKELEEAKLAAQNNNNPLNVNNNNNVPVANADELERLKQELAEERAKNAAAEAARADFLNRIAALQKLLAEYQAGGAPGNVNNNNNIPAGAAAQAFMDQYAQADGANREALFDVAFQDMVASGDQGTVVAVLRFILKEMQALAATAGNNPTADQMEQFNKLQAMQNRIGQSGNLAPGRDQHQRELDAQILRQQRAEDKPAYDNLLANLDASLKTNVVDLTQNALDRDNAEHRSIPVLVHFLRIKHTNLLSGNGSFSKQDWAQWSPFVKYLTVEQMRAIRYHMKQGNFPGTISAGEEIKERIKSFLDTLDERINAAQPPRVMSKGDADIYNTNLSPNLRNLLKVARIN